MNQMYATKCLVCLQPNALIFTYSVQNCTLKTTSTADSPFNKIYSIFGLTNQWYTTAELLINFSGFSQSYLLYTSLGIDAH